MTDEEFYATLGRNMKNARLICGLTGENVGQLRSVKTDSVYKYENGKQRPSVRYVVELADDLHTSTETLLQGCGSRRKSTDVSGFRYLRVMSPDEHEIAAELASTWQGDVKALIFWSYLYAQLPPHVRGELAMPIVMEIEKRIAAGLLPAERLQPIVDYVLNATGGLLDAPEMDTKEACPK